MSQMSMLDEHNLRQSQNLVAGKINNARKNIRRIENENLQLLRRISAISPTYKKNDMAKDRER